MARAGCRGAGGGTCAGRRGREVEFYRPCHCLSLQVQARQRALSVGGNAIEPDFSGRPLQTSLARLESIFGCKAGGINTEQEREEVVEVAGLESASQARP